MARGTCRCSWLHCRGDWGTRACCDPDGTNLVPVLSLSPTRGQHGPCCQDLSLGCHVECQLSTRGRPDLDQLPPERGLCKRSGPDPSDSGCILPGLGCWHAVPCGPLP